MVEENKPNPTPEGNEETPTPEGTEGEQETPEKTNLEPDKLPAQGDYKKRYTNAREGAIILKKEKEDAIERAEVAEAKLADEVNKPPSNEELTKKYPDWEYKEDSEKDTLIRLDKQEKETILLKEKLAWNDDFNRILKKYPQLAKVGDKFKEEAYKHPKSIDLEVIAKSFLFDKIETKPEEEIEEKPKRSGLEKPTGGTGKVPSAKMSLGDITRLRKTNFKLYMKMVNEGKIKEIPEE